MKKAKIVKKRNGVWQLRAGASGKGKLLHSATHVIANQPKSTEHATNALYSEADRQGYEIVSDSE